MFVDAGYLFVAGSEAISGAKLKRSDVRLNDAELIAELKRLATKVSGLPLLRIYWYDGTSGNMSLQQMGLAKCNDLKVRLGAVNSHGQQKGVDSLIITDMISLARNNAMADAVLISGDEDVRVGMQQAQEWGVRVHLLGIEAGRNNQSPALVQEADTCSMWSKDDVQKFMSMAQPSSGSGTVTAVALATPAITTLSVFLSEFIEGLAEPALRACGSPETRSVPADVDGRMLWGAGEALGRKLDDEERRNLRKTFLKECRERAAVLPVLVV